VNCEACSTWNNVWMKKISTDEGDAIARGVKMKVLAVEALVLSQSDMKEGVVFISVCDHERFVRRKNLRAV
jgi:hypothetical protein